MGRHAKLIKRVAGQSLDGRSIQGCAVPTAMQALIKYTHGYLSNVTVRVLLSLSGDGGDGGGSGGGSAIEGYTLEGVQPCKHLACSRQLLKETEGNGLACCLVFCKQFHYVPLRCKAIPQILVFCLFL